MNARWDDIRAFISRRSPERARAFVGVPREEIAQFEARYAIALPALYRDFLATMGKDHGDFYPLGDHYACDLDTLVEQLPGSNYPHDQYHKIGHEADPEAIAEYDLFLDLRRSDGSDAPLVRFEDDEWFNLEAVKEVGFTLADQLVRSAFAPFELRRRRKVREVSIFFESAEELGPAMRQIAAQMHALGLVDVMPGTQKVACLGDDTVSLSIQEYTQLSILYVSIGAMAAKSANRIAEGLLDQFSHASVKG
ncbi:SMI1/KNR4 family protein [Nannocystis punicea]|uniref:SMI1/KNR4 family protein n=1 Tax=Nannocystis punicea TaxID=2995304 RepID=A0ABY7H934_9BACT|nr:SMI1/KNR4 family protein [Nannocystis poenicansa]WAS95767.1 SMI1/KNR4 family protein [Nannocystis poenicansa]